MHKVKSTYKVLAGKVLRNVSAVEWIDWALEMMEAGFESEHLIMLAGTSPHLNRFELDDIVDRTLKELSLDTATREEIIYGYVYYLIDGALGSEISTKTALRALRNLCQDRDYDEAFFNFYLLYYAKDELEELGVQFYWKDATKDTIDSIILNEFTEWKKNYEATHLKTG